MNKQVEVIPTNEELELIKIKREQKALALKEALIHQKADREKSIEGEKKRGEKIVASFNKLNEAIKVMMYNLTDYAGKGIYEIVKVDRKVYLKLSDYELKQDLEGKVEKDYKSKQEVYFEDTIDFQEHHIKHIQSGKEIHAFDGGSKGMVFRPNNCSYGRSYTRAKKLDEIISSEYNSKVAKAEKVVSEAEEQELLYNMCQRAYPQAISIQKFKEAIYRYKGNRRNDREYAGDRLLVAVTFKSNLVINCIYGKPVKEEDKPSINIYSRDVSKLTTEELLKHFGK